MLRLQSKGLTGLGSDGSGKITSGNFLSTTKSSKANGMDWGKRLKRPRRSHRVSEASGPDAHLPYCQHGCSGANPGLWLGFTGTKDLPRRRMCL